MPLGMTSIPFAVGSIVPSTRDFLQTIATRRARLALIPIVDKPEDVARLSSLGVMAVAIRTAEEGAQEMANAAPSLPLLLLKPIVTESDALAARAMLADAVIVDPSLAAAAQEDLSKRARSTRMAALPLVIDEGSAKRAIDAAARAVIVQAATLEEVLRLAAHFPTSTRVIANVLATEAATVRLLLGCVDAAIVDVDVHASTDFESLQAEVDPERQ
ncbi:MAG: hypothetical protein NVS3B20_19540 [Polyangiales bacterium]